MKGVIVTTEHVARKSSDNSEIGFFHNMIKVVKYNADTGRTELYEGETMQTASIVYCEAWKAVPTEKRKDTLIAIFSKDELVESITEGDMSQILRDAMTGGRA